MRTIASEYSKQWRLNNPDKSTANRQRWRARNHEKTLAHLRVQTALRNGKLKRKPCTDCGNLKSQAHHEDYSKPLNVVWLCDLHHKRRHSKQYQLSC